MNKLPSTTFEFVFNDSNKKVTVILINDSPFIFPQFIFFIPLLLLLIVKTLNSCSYAILKKIIFIFNDIAILHTLYLNNNMILGKGLGQTVIVKAIHQKYNRNFYHIN